MSTGCVFFRFDLRVHDHQALQRACLENDHVICVYAYDEKQICGAAQKWWLHHSLLSLRSALQSVGLDLIFRSGFREDVFTDLHRENSIHRVYWTDAVDPYSRQRDESFEKFLKKLHISAHRCQPNLLFQPGQILNQQSEMFKVFTSFWKSCLKKMPVFHIPAFQSRAKHLSGVWSEDIEELKLLPSRPNWAKLFPEHWSPGEKHALHQLHQFLSGPASSYQNGRNLVAESLTSRLSPSLHFGELSVRALWNEVLEAQMLIHGEGFDVFRSEIGWREFAHHFLWHHPQTLEHNWKKEFDAFPWQFSQEYFSRWKTGTTGFPLVDAGMRELYATGFMHNRVRMIVSSFLTKNLRIHWKYGADWFLDTLLDADLANNTLGWQWVAGCGVDAAPYFRIFNPILQAQTFDPQALYIRRWIPELRECDPQKILQMKFVCSRYPSPMIDYPTSRQNALDAYHGLKSDPNLS